MSSPRLLTAVRAVSVSATVLVLGMLWAHVLELAPKRGLDYPTYVAVQLNLYRDWGPVAAVLEPLALLSTVLLAVMVWRAVRRSFVGTTAAALCQLIALILFFTAVNPVNTTQAKWTAASPPADWQHVRDTWEYGHAIRFVLYALAFGFLLATVLAEARRRSALRALAEEARGALWSRR